MLSNELKKLFKLAKKTGDRLVVYDSLSPEDSFVVMDIDSYEKLINDVLEKDIEIKEEDLNTKEKKSIEKIEDNSNLTDENLTDRINREISMLNSEKKPDFLSDEDKNRKPWNIPSDIKKKAKEIE